MKRYVAISTNRIAYSPDQLGETMTVGELIEVLEMYNKNDEVMLRNDDGYTFGNIKRSSFCRVDEEGELA